MNSFLMPQFWVLYGALPEHVRQQARQAYALFQQDPHHPSLRFRQVHPTRPIFSARVGLHYRAMLGELVPFCPARQELRMVSPELRLSPELCPKS